MFNPSRDQARQFLIDAWAKRRQRLPGTPMDTLAADLVELHPEYHELLEAPDALTREWTPEDGETNPFLHLSMHLSISEQISIDQPAGVKTRYAALAARLGDEHAAQHAVMDCLAEMIWRAQRDNQPPDGAAYLLCLEKKCLS